MHQITVTIKNLKQLKEFLSSDEVIEHTENSEKILAMVYTAHVDKQLLEQISNIVLKYSSKVIVTGATTTGEIDNGKTTTDSTTISLLFFEVTNIVPITLKGGFGDEINLAKQLRTEVDKIDPKAVMLLTTPLSSDVNVLIQNFINEPFDFEIFGGGAGDYSMENSLLVSGNEIFESGVTAICFLGETFQIQKHSFVGWQPMSKEMTITSADGTKVFTVDNKPALDIYKKYLNITDDSNFFANAIGFPMLSETKGDYLARVPVNVGENGSLEFITDFKEGEKFRLGFVSPEIIEQKVSDTESKLSQFAPEAIFLFTCGCRRFALVDGVQKETLTFANIAPVSGFYTIGELCDVQGEVPQMNLSFVVIGIKENFTSVKHKNTNFKQTVDTNKYTTSHMTVVGRLLYFINKLNEELEEQIITDSLTSIYNRRHFDEIFPNKINSLKRHPNQLLCFAMMDIDYFKKYNDCYGHQAGDQVLKKVASFLKSTIKRADDFCFRLGGEEFGVIFNADDKEQAFSFADKIRKGVENLNIEHSKSDVNNYVTVSMGLTCHTADSIPNSNELYKETDDLLYKAKENGRNIVQANFELK